MEEKGVVLINYCYNRVCKNLICNFLINTNFSSHELFKLKS